MLDSVLYDLIGTVHMEKEMNCKYCGGRLVLRKKWRSSYPRQHEFYRCLGCAGIWEVDVVRN